MSWFSRFFGQLAKPTSAPSPKAQAAALPVRPQRPVPFGETDTHKFLMVCQILARTTREELLKKHCGVVPSDDEITMINKETGERWDVGAAMRNHIDYAALLYSFGVMSFIAVIFNNRWEKSAGRREVQATIVAELAQRQVAMMPPHLRRELSDDGIRSGEDSAVSEVFKAAELAALTFWRGYYDWMRYYLSEAKVAPRSSGDVGTLVLARWLLNPDCMDENPVFTLQASLAELVGAKYRGPNAIRKLEDLYGVLTRRLISQALYEMDLVLDAQQQ